ncbi:hypothetical protein PI124_g4242 [Phytophthora idaei]|nr:hypothetical protein PI125_g3759 [Phytophthora idaei]KAG3167934.1 hypothetical protein PI126_g3554 [Phytophthora idaei]KAG3251155.1 hypothetical protein PI124_g4242 [Phytophthora idaei]
MSTPSNTAFTIAPTPALVYPSHEEAEAALHEWTKIHGYNVSRRRVRRLTLDF